MLKPIIKSRLIFSRPAEDAVAADASVAQDLIDTLVAHADSCVGLAANMIGSPKRVIAFMDGTRPRTMLNPRIVRSSGPYQTQEACLSLTRTRPATRYRSIEVGYQVVQDGALASRRERFTGFTAQIIQHEIDHTNGIVI